MNKRRSPSSLRDIRTIARGCCAALALFARIFAADTSSASAPTILTQPASQAVALGSPVVLQVAATGSPTPTFQWRKNGVALGGATGSSFVIRSARISDIGSYSVAVTNSAGSVTSGPLALSLNRAAGDGSSVGSAGTGAAVYAFSTLAGYASIGSSDGTGAAARFNFPIGVAVDSAGNAYVADEANHTIRKITPAGVVTTFAGLAGAPGFVNGTGSAARFYLPSGVAIDAGGNLYVADTFNYAIRKITPAGVTTTLATSGLFYIAISLAVDNNGNVYVADRGSHAVWKVTSAGAVSNLAGLAGTTGSADGTGSSARFYYPWGIACDATGANIYVADSGNGTIRKITATGVVTTLAGIAGQYGSADGTGGAARFSDPMGIAVDGSGLIYVTDAGANYTLRKVTPAGVVTTLAGTVGFPGTVDGVGTAARFTYPIAVGADSSGSMIYVSDSGTNTIRKVTSTGAVTTVAGNVGAGSTDGTGATARFSQPSATALDSSGNVYVADTANHTIRKITPAGAVTTFAGQAGTPGSADGVGGAARFNQPTAVNFDTAGNLYVAEGTNHTIRKITGAGVVTTIAGAAGQIGFVNATGTAARFYGPYGLAIDSANNIYVAEWGNSAVRKITPAGLVSTFAGGTSGSSDGTGTSAQFRYPVSLTIDTVGNLYVGDFGGVRKITPGAMVTTLAGVVGTLGFQDGTGSSARFGVVNGVVADAAGYLYVSDNNCIRRISSAGTVSTIAGNGYAGSEDGSTAARFTDPAGLALDSSGRLFLADRFNNTIRLGLPATSPVFTSHPANVSTPAGATVSFSGNATGTPAPSYQWMRRPFGGSFGNVTDTSSYSGSNTATLTVSSLAMAMNGDEFKLYAFNGVSPSATSNIATLTVTNAPYITSPNATTFVAGDSNNFAVVSTGTPAPTFSVVSGSLPGWATLSATGTLSGTPPNTTGSPFIFTIQATNGVGTPATQSFTLTVAVPTPPIITQHPQNAAIPAITGNTTFSVDATGLPAPTFQWQRQPSAATGFVDLANDSMFSGVTTKVLSVAGPSTSMNGDQFRCVATNSSASAASNAATLTVLVAPVITSANNATFEAGVSGSFTVTATSTPAPTFGISAGTLPAWASLNATTGIISGTPPPATGASYTFTVQASNGYQSVFQNFTLAVIVGPIITTQPVSVSVPIGQPAMLNVSASGSGALSYQWRRFGVPIAGATNASYILTSATQADADYYDVAVSDSTGTAISAPARIGVAPIVYPTNLELDPAFDLAVEASSPTVSVLAPHTGGAILVGGTFVRANGKPSRRLARYLATGAIDMTFHPDVGGFSLSAIGVQPDGKILIGGDFYFVNGASCRALARLNPDGSLDPSFNVIVNGSVSRIVIQSDGRILLAGSFSTVNGTARLFLARVNGDGSLDSTFVPAALNSSLTTTLVQSDGKIVIAGFFSTVNGVTRNRIARLLSDGSLDAGFAANGGFSSTINAMVQDSAGDLIVGGAFTSYDSTTANRIAKLSGADGALLSTFGGGFDGIVNALAVQSDDKLVCGGSFAAFNGTSVNRLIRLAAGGGLDSTLAAPTVTGTINTLYVQPADGGIVFGGSSTLAVAGIATPVARVSSTGTQDAAVNVTMRSPGSVYKIEPLPSGKFLIGGIFTHIANAPVSNGIARLNADLTPDTSFNASGSGAGGTVSSVVRLPDGKIAISGSFTSYNATGVGRVARLNADGALDTSFNAGASGASSTADLLVLAPGGRLMLGGAFTSYNGTSTPSGLIRLNVDGTLDSTFNAGSTALSLFSSNALAVQSDGKVYVGGNFTSVNGVTRNRIVRLNPGGSVDTSFDVGDGCNGSVNFVLIQPDGMLLVGGSFSAYRGVSVSSLIRVLPTGLIAPGFAASSSFPRFAILQEDSKIMLLAGTLPSRLTNTGAADFTFAIHSASSYSSGRFSAMRVLDDGRMLLGNTYMGVANQEKVGLMLLKPITAPTISTQPVSQVVYSGTNVTLSVVAGGSAFNTYQWNKNGVPISGATNGALTLNNLSSFDGGAFTVTVTNALGAITSNVATVTVTPTTIAPIPSPFVGVGGTARLTAVVTAASPITYQWSKNGTAIVGATNAALVLSPVASIDAGSYDVAVSTGSGALNSNPIVLTVLPNPIAYSSRQLVGGAGLTAWFAIEGTQPKRVLLRAVGPTLASLGVSGVLADPRIALLRADGSVLFANDNWGTVTGANLPALFSRLGAFSLPIGSLDAAIYATLAPGSYSVRIAGADATPGIALLELFDVDTNPGSRISYVAVRGAADASSASIVGGLTMTNSAAKRVLIRTVGSSVLGASAHPDPQLRILDGPLVVAQNDNWGGTAVLTAAATQAGAFALSPTSNDASVLIDSRVGTGVYTVAIPPNGSAGDVLLEFYDMPALSNSAVAPLIVVSPPSESAVAGGSLTLKSVTVGTDPISYQWRKNGIALSGGTGAELIVSPARPADTGSYDVVVTSALGSAKSTPTTITVGISALHTFNGLGYLPGGTVTITNTLGYIGTADVLGWETTLPSGWTFVSDAGNAGDVKPLVGTIGKLAWAWTTPPRSPVTFSYTVRAPVDAAGPQSFSAEGIVRSAGTSTRPAADPAVLVINPMPTHSADTDLDFHISLLELTRVIELYNTRNGSSRTGAYRVDPAGEDGFAPDPSRAVATSAMLTRYHSADTRTAAAGSPADGRIDLFELTRVIDLYNFRTGTTRTGQYHVQAGTEDGFGSGP